MTNQIVRITDKIDEYRKELTGELVKEDKNDVRIKVLKLRIKVFEDKKKQMIKLVDKEKELFEKSRTRKRGRTKKNPTK
jgi:hypothetical protein